MHFSAVTLLSLFPVFSLFISSDLHSMWSCEQKHVESSVTVIAYISQECSQKPQAIIQALTVSPRMHETQFQASF